MRFSCLLLCLSMALWAQAPPRSDDPSTANPQEVPQELPSSSDQGASATGRPGAAPADKVPVNPNDSSSRKSIIDLTPPTGDIQSHPESQATQDSVNEMGPWDPHRAYKDIEVGDFYFKRKNYRGAESRYRDALIYKPNDAVSTFRLGQICERTGRISEAVHFYESYLKILPHGVDAAEAHKSITKLQAELNPPK